MYRYALLKYLYVKVIYKERKKLKLMIVKQISSDARNDDDMTIPF